MALKKLYHIITQTPVSIYLPFQQMKEIAKHTGPIQRPGFNQLWFKINMTVYGVNLSCEWTGPICAGQKFVVAKLQRNSSKNQQQPAYI